VSAEIVVLVTKVANNWKSTMFHACVPQCGVSIVIDPLHHWRGQPGLGLALNPTKGLGRETAATGLEVNNQHQHSIIMRKPLVIALCP
jgi:hypothetical protein